MTTGIVAMTPTQLYLAWQQVAAFTQAFPRVVDTVEYRKAHATQREALSEVGRYPTPYLPGRLRLRQERGTKNMELLKAYIGKSGWVSAYKVEFLDFDASQSYIIAAGAVGGAAMPVANAQAILRLENVSGGQVVTPCPDQILSAEVENQTARVQLLSRRIFEREAEQEEDSIERFAATRLADCVLHLKECADSDCSKTAYWKAEYAEACHELNFRRKRQILNMQSHIRPTATNIKQLLAFEWTF